jgi:hypothetical protein
MVAPDVFSEYVRRVVTISITPEAFAAIEATLAKRSKADARPDGKGGYLIVLRHAVLDRLKAMRGPGERC